MKRSVLLFLLFFPAILHLGAFSFCVVKYGNIDFTVYDLLFYVFFMCYLLVAVVFARDAERVGRLTLVVYSVIIGVVVSDAMLRFLVPTKQFATPWIPMHRVSRASEAMPGIFGEIELTVNRYGLRGPDVELKDFSHKIICVGGSTTESLYVTDRKSWPWLLMDKLNGAGRPDRVFVGNAGRSGHFSLHHEVLLENYAFLDQFDWVVFLVGINDMGRLLRGDYAAQKKLVEDEALEYKYAYKSSPYYDRLMANIVFSFGRVRPSAVAQVQQDPEGMWYNDMRQLRKKALAVREVDQLPSALPEMLQQYRVNLLRLIDICRQKGVRMVFMTQPTLYRQGLPAFEEGLLWQHIDADSAYAAGVLEQLMNRYNEVLMEVCREEGVACLDLSAKLPKDATVFYDDCHFNISGSGKVADVLFDFFSRNLQAH